MSSAKTNRNDSVRVGDMVKIQCNPVTWSSKLSPNQGTKQVKYPYECVVEEIVHEASHSHFRCNNGYGWSWSDECMGVIIADTNNFEEIEI